MTFRKINEDILRTLGPPSRMYLANLGLILAVLALGVYAFSYQVRTGLGVAG